MKTRARTLVPPICLASLLLVASHPARALSFEQRVRAQEAIERVHHSHRIDASRPFDQAVPRAVIEEKVQKYLQQAAALERLWRTPINPGMLQRELERMVEGTRMPGRLLELFSALDRDPVLLRECLARPLLVDRLVSNFFEQDERIHAGARAEAEKLRADLQANGSKGEVAPVARELVELARDVRQAGEAEKDPGTAEALVRRRRELVPPEEYDLRRTELLELLEGIGRIQEQHDAFVIPVLLEDRLDSMVVALHRVDKVDRETWWRQVTDTLRGQLIEPAVEDSEPGTEALDVSLHELMADFTQAGERAPCVADNTWHNASLDDVPDGRDRHSAVWTGSEMIIWGGGNNWNTGARYDPVTDTWAPISRSDAPSGRLGPTAVWTGTVMLIWGGGSTTGGRYDPVSDAWTPISPENAPAAYTGISAVWTGTEMIVWGGRSGGSTYEDTGGRYDPVADEWTPTSTLGAPEPRSGHKAVWTGSRMIVWGGAIDFQEYVNTGAQYEPETDSWAPISTIDTPSARAGHGTVWTGSEMIVWGGGSDTGGRYRPITDSWLPTSLENAPDNIGGHATVWTGAEMVVWGGYDDGYVNTGGRYDPLTNSWAPISTENAPWGRVYHTAVWTGDLMLVWGGYPGWDNYTGGRYDPATDTWTRTSTGNAPSKRSLHTAVWTGNEMIVWGGYHSHTTGGRYDPATDSWRATATAGAPSGRHNHTAVWTGDRMVVWGGERSSSQPLGTGGRYDPATDSWLPTSMLRAPEARSRHTSVWTGQEMVVWGGGPTDYTFLDTGGRYDPVDDRWTPISLSEAPSPRYSHTAVWTGTEMMVWGGWADQIVSSGGRYDPVGDRWTPITMVDAPGPRRDHNAIWTGSEMIVWGCSSGWPLMREGARYDPSSDSWTMLSEVDAPDFAWGSALWTGKEMVLWSVGARYDPASDTWSPMSARNTPQARYAHGAVWTGSDMIVWGGVNNARLLHTGGIYALGHSDDDDGDGMSECAGDCNDGDGQSYPGAIEICDGRDNDCDGTIDDGAAAPGVTTGLRATGSVEFSWNPTAGADSYDFVRADLTALRATRGDFENSLVACIADDAPGLTAGDTAAPAAGEAFLYLVRAVGCGTFGTYDSGAASQQGWRDEGIDAGGTDCP